MAEKRVSVRLSATGGRQVKAELTGVGEAGGKAFGRLSREMEAANKLLAGFSRAVSRSAKIAAAALSAAVTGMIRSGLDLVDSQAKLAQSLGTTLASIQAIPTVLCDAGRLASTVAAFAGFFVGRWVAGLAAATLSVCGLTTALVELWGALIVSVCKLIEQYGRPVVALGGIGEALGLPKDAGREAWHRIKDRHCGDGCGPMRRADNSEPITVRVALGGW